MEVDQTENVLKYIALWLQSNTKATTLTKRELNAVNKFAEGVDIVDVSETRKQVPSFSREGIFHTVDMENDTCSCEDKTWNPELTCQHQYIVSFQYPST